MSTATFNRYAKHAQRRRRAEMKAKRDKVEMWVQGPRYESPAAFRRRMRLAGE